MEEKDEKKDEQDSSSYPFLATAKPQPAEKKPERKSYKPKEKPLPVALRSCVVGLENATVTLVEGQPVSGLTSQELKHLKFHKFVK
jgi:hypothetical protein